MSGHVLSEAAGAGPPPSSPPALTACARVWAVGIRCDATPPNSPLMATAACGCGCSLQLILSSIRRHGRRLAAAPAGYGERVAAPSPAGEQRPGRALGQSGAVCARDRWSNNYTASLRRRRAVSTESDPSPAARGVTSRGGGVRSCPPHAAPATC